MTSINEFDYDLPEELIAQTPLENRSDSRLLVANRSTGNYTDKVFKNIIDYLNPGDALVLNNTRVLPTRLHGQKQHTGGHHEVLLTRQIEGDKWEVMISNAKRTKPGTVIEFADGLLTMEVLDSMDDGTRIGRFDYDGIFYEVLAQVGETPLPPYIKEKLDDDERYQTVYAKENGSAAAPTAGLHFTEPLLDAIKAKGVKVVQLTLHVGLGTFGPVREENIEEHEMHKEYYILDEEAARTLNEVKASGHDIVACGTTVVRTLESIATKFNGEIKADADDTGIFIKPGYEFKAIDHLITNFHLPKSTLMMLVSAFAGKDFMLSAYHHAVTERYRFFSFGDAMYII